ncbi:MAG: hypothetical protein HYI21_08550 [Sediminibacterium sp. Gen4]|jgi:hypothetical protein|uniref:hypothetical protein n=1 Tax=unclassified Sediminibacterium TaxID=2635961 RepID=UPI0015BB6E0D|nr:MULTISPECIES: hypothetical protein [unclassified Sediminibacterium]MBW0162410.1 hypothetical protein [Sediminibacterium sp.]MBW0164618.1 hypothetical protein [Sediminibacterium sp.]MDZ4071107.1 hypothetical protein [Sediminibacterium sp.]NWK66062.1 hypothetical protein [Sediminibacterium sp. Gen4]
MEIENLWLEIKCKHVKADTGKLNVRKLRNSNNPVLKLRNSIEFNTWFGIASILGCIYLTFQFTSIYIYSLMLILIIQSGYFTWRLYQSKLEFEKLSQNWNQSIIQALQIQIKLFKKTIQLLELRSMVFMPLGYLAGSMMIYDKNAISQDNPVINFSVIKSAIILALITMPILYFGLKWFHKISFGKYIEETEDTLIEWEDFSDDN